MIFPTLISVQKRELAFVDFWNSNDYSSLTVLCDSNTAEHCFPLLEPQLLAHDIEWKLICVKAGEEQKVMDSAMMIWRELNSFGVDRKGLLLNLGGGMITDLGAFAASLFKRGIDFVNIPTSLLAMVDAAIGGKNGIDLDSSKNQIGSFVQPRALFLDINFLQTLPEMEIKSGMAEVYKHALIKDAILWTNLRSSSNANIQEELIRSAANLKQEVVEQDPYEANTRKILNFGHTIGHAIESHFLRRNRSIPHGFAIAAGIICEAYLSVQMLDFPKSKLADIANLFKEVYGKLSFTKEEISVIISYTKNDKKNKGAKILAVLLKDIGDAVYDQELNEEQIRSSLEYYLNEY